MTRTRRTFTKAFKLEAVKTADTDGLGKAANAFQVAPGQITRWRKEVAPERRIMTSKQRSGPESSPLHDSRLESLRMLKQILDSLLSV